MAKSHPAIAPFDDQDTSRLAQWVRSTSVSFALLACFISLAVIHFNQHSARLASALVEGIKTLDLTQLMVPPDDQEELAVSEPYEPKYRAIGDYLARRYRVSSEMATDIVARAYAIGREARLDPILILAVISVESSFNPGAESSMGAKGLMQVIPRFHAEKFDPLGGEESAFDLDVNIMVGAQVLKQYIRRAGDLADALRMYVGASSDENENGFSAKVLTERERLRLVLQQYQDGSRRSVHSQPAVKVLALAS